MLALPLLVLRLSLAGTADGGVDAGEPGVAIQASGRAYSLSVRALGALGDLDAGVDLFKILKSFGYSGGACEPVMLRLADGAQQSLVFMPSQPADLPEFSGTTVGSDPRLRWHANEKRFALTLLQVQKRVAFEGVVGLQLPRLPLDPRDNASPVGVYRRPGFYSKFDWVRISKSGTVLGVSAWSSDDEKVESSPATPLQKSGDTWLWQNFVSDTEPTARVDLRLEFKGPQLAVFIDRVEGQPNGDWDTIKASFLPDTCPYLRIRER